MADKLPNYGGQALIEGVLMRGSRALAAAMRAPDGSIVVQTELLQGIYKNPIARLPFLRGLVILWDSLGLGMRFLTTSANLQTGEDEKLEGKTLFLTMGSAMLLAVGVFFLAPVGIAHLFENLFGLSSWASNLIEGLVRLIFMIGYIWGIGKMPDIQRVFAYHGAEHKTINAFEAGVELTPENVARCSLEHPRCGTSFLLTLILFSIIVFALLGDIPTWLRYSSRVVFIPVLAGLAYEYIRWIANHLNHPLIRWLIKPNLALQKLTTRQPSLDIIEVAIAAFNAMLNLETGAVLPAAQPAHEPVEEGSIRKDG